jgi:apolipoprotein N-acyltransferase
MTRKSLSARIDAVPSVFLFLLSAVLGLLCFPPIGIWPFAYAAMIPFLFAATTTTPRRAMAEGYLAGFIFFGGLLYWIGINKGAPPALAWASAAVVVAILATVWSITGWVVARIARSHGVGWAVTIFVSLYMFFEVFWGTGELGFPWAIWALSQVSFLPAIQMADLGDVYLVSCWVLALNALLFLIWRQPQQRRRWGAIAVVVFVIPLLYGWIRMALFQPGREVPVAAIQGNTEVDEKWQKSAEEILENYLALTRTLQGSGTDLAVWPETATPMPIRFRPWAVQKVYALVDSLQTSVFTGATDYEKDDHGDMIPYNASFLFRYRGQDIERAAKVHLVPFGERIPLQKYLPVLGKIRLGQAEFRPGENPIVFPAKEKIPAFGSLICFEVLFPDVAADLVCGGALMLANITEDGWYNNSSGPYQHLALTRLRAVAARRSIIRAANTGISALIDPVGRIRNRLGYGKSGVIRGTLPCNSAIPVAARLARIWLPFYTVVFVILCVILRMRRRPYTTPLRT